MINFDLREAQLFRMLSDFFGGERVVPHMSVMCVCSGEFPSGLAETLMADGEACCTGAEDALEQWARASKCLFTIVDGDDSPCMVIEFEDEFDSVVAVERALQQKYIRPVLHAVRIPYVTVGRQEFLEILDPDGSLDFFSFLKDKFEPLSQQQRDA